MILFVDITDLVSLRGTGGIARVVSEIADNISKIESDKYDIRFMYFDYVLNGFFEIDKDHTLNRQKEIGALQNVLTFLIKKIDKGILARLLRGLYRKLVIRANLVDFTKLDAVLVIGMAWENLNIKETLRQQRRQNKFILAQVVYDLIINLYPHLHHPSNVLPYNIHMRSVIEDSDILFPISKSTSADIARYAKEHNIKIPKRSVIRLGDIVNLNDKDIQRPDNFKQDRFILCVGTIEVRKNHVLLYYTYKLAQQRGVALPTLVIVGNSGWYTGDIQYLLGNDRDIAQKIIILNGIKDKELGWLYKNAEFSVYPSIYEGWGLPIAESLSYGTPVIASQTSSMPEIGDDLVDYISPYSTDELLNLIVANMQKNTQEAKRKLIQSKYKQTSWSETAASILNSILEYKNDAQ